MNRIVIIGGGLAGLSAAYHLREHDPLVLERESELGGLCRSFFQDGFTFDCTGHLVHLRNPYTRELVDRLLPDAFNSYERLASIYSKSTLTPYPFQANTHGLPPEVVKECLTGFIETLRQKHLHEPRNFKEWTLQTFGAGIAKHFMLPYNEKFWKDDLRNICADWVSWSIPKPKLEEVINGALGLTNKGMGYNPRFIYPRSGGINCLPLAFAGHVRRIDSEVEVHSIDPVRRVVRTTDGREEPYDHLITTLPVPTTYRLLSSAPERLRDDASRLKAIAVLNINIGVDRPRISDQHWMYFPESDYIFSRVGFPMNFSAAVAPPETSSIYVEITHPEDAAMNVEEAFERSIDGLVRCGILRKDDRILTRHVIDLKCAYVVFDRHRQSCIQGLTDYLASQDIYSCGRYGRWDYFSMEDSILSGKAAAEAIEEKLATLTVPV